MNIVVLDGYTLNPGDLSWESLESLGHCTIHDRTAAAETFARAAEAEIVLTNKAALPRELIERLPRLRYIGVLATGFNIVDVEAARERNIPVTNVPDYATNSVAQSVFAHLLNLTLHTAAHGRGVAEGRWTACPDFAYWDFPLVELAGLTLGLVGFGRIGRATARVAKAFGMTVLAYDVNLPSSPLKKSVLGNSGATAGLSSSAGVFPRKNTAGQASSAGVFPRKNTAGQASSGTLFQQAASDAPEGVEFVEMEDLFSRSDAVSLHCPLTPDTHHLVNTERLALMKPTAYLINTGRGPLIDETALAEALNAGQIAGAGVDVLSTEPPPADNPLLRAKNCCITPHIAWATAAARRRLLDTVVRNVRAFLDDKPQNVVNP